MNEFIDKSEGRKVELPLQKCHKKLYKYLGIIKWLIMFAFCLFLSDRASKLGDKSAVPHLLFLPQRTPCHPIEVVRNCRVKELERHNDHPQKAV